MARTCGIPFNIFQKPSNGWFAITMSGLFPKFPFLENYELDRIQFFKMPCEKK